MKYLFQQILSHIGIVLISFILLSAIVSYFVESMVFQEKEDELVQYGESILDDLTLDTFSDSVTLNQYANVLTSRNIYFQLFDTDGNIQYPIENRGYKIQFTNEEWERIIQGKKVIVKIDLRRFEQAVSLVIIPFKKGNAFFGGIMLAAPVSGTREMISQFQSYLFYTVMIVLFLSLILSWLLSFIHVRRIKQLQKATSAVTAGNYDISVPASNFDEIGELAGDFNKMVKKLKQSNEEIQILENRRRQFIADVSHELRTPLTTISGVVEGLRNDMIPESEKQRGLELVSKESKRLIRLVNENLDYEKIRSNQIKLNKEILELSDVLEVIKDQLTYQASKKNNQILVEVKGKPVVYADYDRLIQIFLNITKNSIQFTDNGIITLKGQQRGSQTIIDIEDTGVGIDPKDIENIWERFYRADLSRKSNPFGEFGLGLSIVKQLVLLHEGEIRVASNKGKGTIFRIVLPANPEK